MTQMTQIQIWSCWATCSAVDGWAFRSYAAQLAIEIGVRVQTLPEDVRWSSMRPYAGVFSACAKIQN